MPAPPTTRRSSATKTARTSTPSSKSCRYFFLGPQQSGRVQAGVGQRRLAQARVGQPRLPQIGKGEIGAVELRDNETGASHQRTTEIGGAEVGAARFDLEQQRLNERRALQIGG